MWPNINNILEYSSTKITAGDKANCHLLTYNCYKSGVRLHDRNHSSLQISILATCYDCMISISFHPCYCSTQNAPINPFLILSWLSKFPTPRLFVSTTQKHHLEQYLAFINQFGLICCYNCC